MNLEKNDAFRKKMIRGAKIEDAIFYIQKRHNALEAAGSNNKELLAELKHLEQYLKIKFDYDE